MVRLHPLGPRQNRSYVRTLRGSATAQPGPPVEELPGNIEMPGMPRRLLDHVQHDPTNIGWDESAKVVLAQWWRREWGCRQHRLGLRALVAVEGDALR